MLEVIEFLAWIAEIANLDIETMTPVKRTICIAIYGAIGLLFAGGGLVPLFDDRPDNTGKIVGGLLVSMLGLAFLARIAYGLFALRRPNRGSA